jgi:hypothetical protein
MTKVAVITIAAFSLAKRVSNRKNVKMIGETSRSEFDPRRVRNTRINSREFTLPCFTANVRL